MPEICRFLGIIIQIYYDDHHPPHFHARYGDKKAAFEIDSLNMVEGDLPIRVRSLVIEWADKHKEELRKDWELAQEGKVPNKIEPLV